MEEIATWAAPIFVVILSIWGVVKLAGTKSEKVGDFVEKADPFVDAAADVAEKVLEKDLDGDGDVGGRPAS